MLRFIANLKILKAIHNIHSSTEKAKELRFIANLKILKAIHNRKCPFGISSVVAIYRKFKNFESNSQPLGWY